jgi:hypothetical protein
VSRFFNERFDSVVVNAVFAFEAFELSLELLIEGVEACDGEADV